MCTKMLIHCWWEHTQVRLLNQCGEFIKKLEIDIPYDPTIQVQGKYPKDSIFTKQIAALFIYLQNPGNRNNLDFQELINGQFIIWYIYTIEQDSDLEKKQLTFENHRQIDGLRKINTE